MATPTNVTIHQDASQFRGVYDCIRVVRCTVDMGSIAANGVEMTSIPVPGADPAKDVVMAFNRADDYTDHSIMDFAHIHTDLVHLVSHNTSGGSFNPPSSDYVFVVARLIN